MRVFLTIALAVLVVAAAGVVCWHLLLRPIAPAPSGVALPHAGGETGAASPTDGQPERVAAPAPFLSPAEDAGGPERRPDSEASSAGPGVPRVPEGSLPDPPAVRGAAPAPVGRAGEETLSASGRQAKAGVDSAGREGDSTGSPPAGGETLQEPRLLPHEREILEQLERYASHDGAGAGPGEEYLDDDPEPIIPEVSPPEPDGPGDLPPGAAEEDTEPPYLNSMLFLPEAVYPGETAILNLVAEDDLSGIGSIEGFLADPSGTPSLPFRCDPGPDAWFRAGRIVIPPSAKPGDWAVATVSLEDRAGNRRVYERGGDGLLAATVLRVLSPEGDTLPPELVRIVAPDVPVEQGRAFTIRVEVTDQGSGVKSVTGDLRGPEGGRVHLVASGTSDPSVFESRVMIPKDVEAGRWAVERIRAADRAGNEAVFGSGDARLAGATVQVLPAADQSPPVLLSIAFDPPSVPRGGSLTVTLEVQDEGSGAAGASGFAGDRAGDYEAQLLSFYPAGKTGRFVARLAVPSDAPTGEWVVRKLTVYDFDDNGRTYEAGRDGELDDAAFRVF